MNRHPRRTDGHLVTPLMLYVAKQLPDLCLEWCLSSQHGFYISKRRHYVADWEKRQRQKTPENGLRFQIIFICTRKTQLAHAFNGRLSIVKPAAGYDYIVTVYCPDRGGRRLLKICNYLHGLKQQRQLLYFPYDSLIQVSCFLCHKCE